MINSDCRESISPPTRQRNYPHKCFISFMLEKCFVHYQYDVQCILQRCETFEHDDICSSRMDREKRALN